MNRVKRNGTRFCALLAAFMAVVSAPPCFAGREMEPWDTLPGITQIIFSPSVVGFIDKDGRRFIMEREGRSFHEVSTQTFAGLLKQKTVRSRLETSDGRVLSTRDANCSAEGDNSPHTLLLDGAAIKDQCAPCSSIISAEIADESLWLGTRFDGEYGEYPAEGIVVQALDNGALKARLSTKNGLTGNLVRVIRLDPFTGSLWAGTNAGINEISPDAKSVFAGHMYEDFDPADGSPAIFLSSVPRNSNPLAVLSREIRPARPGEYYAAALTIPGELWNCLTLNDGFPAPPCEARYDNEAGKNFLPKEFNALLPFLLEAASSSDEARLSASVGRLCRFNDRRVYDFFTRAEKRPLQQQTYLDYLAKDCLGKYERFGLVLSPDKKQRADALAGKLTLTLAKIKAAGASDKAYYDYMMNSADGMLPMDSVVSDAKALIGLGDTRGTGLINDYFRSARGSGADADLFERIQASLYPYEELAPAMMAGLEKIIGARASSGCRFFDMTYPSLFNKPRYNAGYLPSILAALENAVPEKVPHQPEQATWVRDACRTAFLTQIKDAGVKSEFLKKYYPALTPARKKIADGILSGADAQR